MNVFVFESCLGCFVCGVGFVVYKEKTAYEWRISDWSSDVCASDLRRDHDAVAGDLLDAPGRGAEEDVLPRPALMDHLLVELADPRPSGREQIGRASCRERVFLYV